MPEPRAAAPAGKAAMPRPKKLALIVIAAVLAVSVAARVALGGGGGGGDQPAKVAPSSVGPTGQGFMPGQEPAPGQPGAATQSEEEAKVAQKLPYVTEASFFALIGFALGYASRKVVKVGLIFLGIFFVALQVLVYMDVVAIDWSRSVELVNKFVLNVKEGETVQQVITAKLPTAGGLVAGYLLGFRKG